MITSSENNVGRCRICTSRNVERTNHHYPSKKIRRYLKKHMTFNASNKTKRIFKVLQICAECHEKLNYDKRMKYSDTYFINTELRWGKELAKVYEDLKRGTDILKDVEYIEKILEPLMCGKKEDYTKDGWEEAQKLKDIFKRLRIYLS